MPTSVVESFQMTVARKEERGGRVCLSDSDIAKSVNDVMFGLVAPGSARVTCGEQHVRRCKSHELHQGVK